MEPSRLPTTLTLTVLAIAQSGPSSRQSHRETLSLITLQRSLWSMASIRLLLTSISLHSMTTNPLAHSHSRTSNPLINAHSNLNTKVLKGPPVIIGTLNITQVISSTPSSTDQKKKKKKSLLPANKYTVDFS